STSRSENARKARRISFSALRWAFGRVGSPFSTAPRVTARLSEHRPGVGELRTRGRRAMAGCEVCGNDYDKAFEVTMGGETHTFDAFECAIHALAPECAHCGCKIIGHGV